MKPNIIFILLDGARWDRLEVSKEFSQLKEFGVLFKNVITAAPYTFASINVIFSGLYGKENGVDAYYKMFRLKKNIEFLPEVLKKNGYFTSCDLITDKVISSRGFDIYDSHNEYEDDLSKRHPEIIKESFNKAKGKPVFSFLQFSRIHTVTVSEILKKYEWDDKEFYKLSKNNLINYDNVFLEAGKYALTIYNTIKQLDKNDNTLLIFFSDHGTGVGERFGERNYGVFTFEETIRTFYLFIGPKIKKCKISEKLLSTVDIFPTILDFVGIKINKQNFGKSFASYMLNDIEKLPDRDFAFTETGGLQGPFPSPREPNVFCVKTKTHKLIYYKTPKKWELYDLKNDPDEKSDIFGNNLPIEKKLKQELLNWINR